MDMAQARRWVSFAVPQRPAATRHRVLTHAMRALRLALLGPVAACVLVAWLAAAALATVWLVLAAPFRGGRPPTLD